MILSTNNESVTNERIILRRSDLVYPELSYKIIGSAFDVYNHLGSGHYERYYQKALAETFSSNGLYFKQQVYYPIKYHNKIMAKNFIDVVNFNS